MIFVWYLKKTLYVYVRVRNRSCVTYNTNDGQLSLYWAITGGPSTMANWDGTYPALGNLIGSQPLGYISDGNEKIYVFQWNVENIFSPWNTKCLLARIENVVGDPLPYFAPDSHVAAHVKESNNIAMYNCLFIFNATPD